MIDDIAQTPAALRAAVQGLTPQQIETPYRDGGWTVRQVTHHVPESHMNAYIRFKLALTEDSPTIKPYMEDRWARYARRRGHAAGSLAGHARLAARPLGAPVALPATAKTGSAPSTIPNSERMPLEKNLALYSWHGRHHVAHVTELRKRMGW